MQPCNHTQGLLATALVTPVQELKACKNAFAVLLATMQAFLQVFRALAAVLIRRQMQSPIQRTLSLEDGCE